MVRNSKRKCERPKMFRVVMATNEFGGNTEREKYSLAQQKDD